MKYLFTIILFCLASINIYAQETNSKIEFINETIDYGKIDYGSNGLRKFIFKNTGNSPLVISKVTSSCGCTVPKKPKAPIAPGETGEIEVKYDTKRTGFIRKTITVTSNAANVKNGISYLKIKGEVQKKDSSSILVKKQNKKPTSIMNR